MKQNTLAVLYGLANHLASIAAVATLMGTGHLSEGVGAPILAGLVGIGVGAGAALIIPGAIAAPSSDPAQPSSAGSAVLASTDRPQVTAAPTQLVEAMQPTQTATGGAGGTPGGSGGQPAAT